MTCMKCMAKDAKLAKLRAEISELRISRDRNKQDKEKWMKAWMEQQGLGAMVGIQETKGVDEE